MSIFITPNDVSDDNRPCAKPSDLLDQNDEFLVVEALHALLATKREAFRCVTAEFRAHAPTVRFTERDFAIPQIARLIERLGDEVEAVAA